MHCYPERFWSLPRRDVCVNTNNAIYFFSQDFGLPTPWHQVQVNRNDRQGEEGGCVIFLVNATLISCNKRAAGCRKMPVNCDVNF